MPTTSIATARESAHHLRELSPPARRRGAKPTIVDKVKRAFEPQSRAAAWIGLAWGAFVPAAACAVSHRAIALGEAASSRDHVLAAIGGALGLACLAFSAPTVYRWSVEALGSRLKAWGFVVLLEGVSRSWRSATSSRSTRLRRRAGSRGEKRSAACRFLLQE